MKAFALALILAAPLASWAQALTPADSILIDELIAVSGIVKSTETTQQMMESMSGMAPFMDEVFSEFSPEAGVDSIRAAFARDFRGADIRETIRQLEDPSVQPIIDFERALDGGFGAVQEEIEAVMQNPDAYALADSLLVADYVTALGWTERTGGMTRGIMTRMMRSFPGADEEAAAHGMSVDAYADSLMSSNILTELELQIFLVSRYTLKDVDKGAVLRLTDFYESDAGHYYQSTLWDGSKAAAEPMFDRLITMFGEMFQAIEELEEPEPVASCKKGSPNCKAFGAPPPSPPPAPARE